MIDRRQFILSAAAPMIGSSLADISWAEPSNSDRFVVHEPTEIAWIIAALSPLGRDGAIRRDTPYFAAVERWFAHSTTHPVIAALGPDFNLPRLVGNAADYLFQADGALSRVLSATPLWDDAEGDLFTKYRLDIEDFSKRSNARAFLKQQAPILAAADHALRSAVDMTDIKTWLEAEFTERPAPIQLLVSPLTGGWNWTNLGGVKPRVWIPEPKADALDSPVKRFGVVASVFTEVDHIYVNPITRKYAATLEAGFAKAKGWAIEQAWVDYASPELVFNEYMTWSAFLEYARARMVSADYQTLSRKIVRFMEKDRGFVRFGEFLYILKGISGRSGKTLQDDFPAIIAAATA